MKTLYSFSDLKRQRTRAVSKADLGAGHRQKVGHYDALGHEHGAEIISAIRTDNLARLTSIPGVGKKTAERLVIELRDKVGQLSQDASAASRVISPPLTAQTSRGRSVGTRQSGYRRNASEEAIQQAVKTAASVQKLLRAALQILAK